MTASAFAQRAGSGADQIASFADSIEGLPTEGTLFGLPVNVHGQTTYINQRYNNFTSSYSGMNSLSANKSMSYTWSGTLFFGARIAQDTDIYFNPEVVSGVPFSGLTGLGGFTNGEATKANGAQAKFYSARAFLRQTINQEGDKLTLDNEANQITQMVSVLAYRNKMILARFSDATNYIVQNNAQGTQAINNVRNNYQYKTGVGLHAEQALTKDLGIYGRAFTSDGHTETMAFTEADNSLSIGMGLNGQSWDRPKDSVGISMMQNGLSSYRRNYLQTGGVSYFIGDYAGPNQTISYRPERIAEMYYNATVIKNVLFGINYQHVSNPAYNSARGPVQIYSFRVHAEF